MIQSIRTIHHPGCSKNNLASAPCDMQVPPLPFSGEAEQVDVVASVHLLHNKNRQKISGCILALTSVDGVGTENC